MFGSAVNLRLRWSSFKRSAVFGKNGVGLVNTVTHGALAPHSPCHSHTHTHDTSKCQDVLCSAEYHSLSSPLLSLISLAPDIHIRTQKHSLKIALQNRAFKNHATRLAVDPSLSVLFFRLFFSSSSSDRIESRGAVIETFFLLEAAGADAVAGADEDEAAAAGGWAGMAPDTLPEPVKTIEARSDRSCTQLAAMAAGDA